ncbi:MAG: hypothetical protein AB7V50_03310 [Vampirovibrionia bacterium]
MIKKSILVMVTVLLTANSAFADFKYTEEHITKMQMPGMGMMGGMMGGAMGGMQGMPPQMMNQMMSQMNQMNQPNVDKRITFVKGNKKRVDELKNNTSLITICDKKQSIRLNHQTRTYFIEDMNQRIKQMESMCNQQGNSPDFTTEIPQNPYMNNQNQPQGQLIIKNSIIDTKQDEMIGSLKARHYIKTTEISGAPNCMPSMKQQEDVWAANINFEDIECPVFSQFKGCNKMPNMPKMPNNNCFKNAKHINEGLTNIPGFIVKRIMNMDMGQMMQGMGPQGMGMQGSMPDFMGGNMKVEDTTIITDISSNPLPDSLFEIPEGYREESNPHFNRGF